MSQLGHGGARRGLLEAIHHPNEAGVWREIAKLSTAEGMGRTSRVGRVLTGDPQGACIW